MVVEFIYLLSLHMSALNVVWQRMSKFWFVSVDRKLFITVSMDEKMLLSRATHSRASGFVGQFFVWQLWMEWFNNQVEETIVSQD